MARSPDFPGGKPPTNVADNPPPPSDGGGGIGGIVGGAVNNPGIQPFPTFGPTMPGLDPFSLQAGLTGQDRYNHLVQTQLTAGIPANGPDFDQWLLTQQSDPTDAEFNMVLSGAQAQAHKRMDSRNAIMGQITPEQEKAIEAGQPVPPSDPNAVKAATQPLGMGIGGAVLGAARNAVAGGTAVQAGLGQAAGGGVAAAVSQQQEDTANARAANEDKTRGKPVDLPEIVDANWNPVAQANSSSQAASGQTGAIVGGAVSAGVETIGKQVRDGKYVYVGTLPDKLDTSKLAAGNLAANKDQYMSTDNAKALLGGMDPSAIKVIQKALNLPQTGVPDEKTFAAWTQVIDTSARLTQAGKKMTPMAVFGAMIQATKVKGTGGGGGGGAGAGYQPSQVQYLLTAVAQKELGRDPTQAEVDQFNSYINGLGKMKDPQQAATDWIRTHAGKEMGAYKAGTDYYQAMLSVLGKSAVGGASG